MNRKRSWNENISRISRIFREWGVSTYEIRPLQPSGRRNAYQSVRDRVVFVRFWRYGHWIEVCASAGMTAQDNLEQCASVVERLQAECASGLEMMMVDAYRQLYPQTKEASPPKVEPPKVDKDPYAVLGVTASYPLNIIEMIWKAHLRVCHPDAGGGPEGAVLAARYNAAMAEIRKRKTP